MWLQQLHFVCVAISRKNSGRFGMCKSVHSRYVTCDVSLEKKAALEKSNHVLVSHKFCVSISGWSQITLRLCVSLFCTKIWIERIFPTLFPVFWKTRCKTKGRLKTKNQARYMLIIFLMIINFRDKVLSTTTTWVLCADSKNTQFVQKHSYPFAINEVKTWVSSPCNAHNLLLCA